jgi:hypothetical protein
MRRAWALLKDRGDMARQTIPAPGGTTRGRFVHGCDASTIDGRAGIDVVRGRIDDATRSDVLAFWAAQEALDPAEAQRRLAEVVCVLRGAGGAIEGVCTAFAADVPLIGGRRFWVHRSLLPGTASLRFFDLVAASFGALEAEFDGAPGAPLGLCVLLAEPERSARPQAEWNDPRMIYAGYLADGRQVRIAYVEGARVGV